MNLDDVKELKRRLGFGVNLNSDEDRRRLAEVINAKLWFRGQPIVGEESELALLKSSKHLLANLQEKNRLLAEYHCPADTRIQDFLDRYLADCGCDIPRLPTNALQLEHHGLSRTLSLPPDKDSYTSEYVESYRIEQGVLHNPRSDRRTTKGVFHIVEGGLPVPNDKKVVPRNVFAALLGRALCPPQSVMEIPFTSSQEERARLFVSLLLRPLVLPGVEGVCEERSLETRFFAPGSLVSNLDFVESIFGNAGDPYLMENDAALDPEHWTGHTGCVVLAPHLVLLGKKELGLPHVSEATERQKRDGMCWESAEERYNDGGGFKVACRVASGGMVSLIADNYFGYCKKEVKTQISFSANLLGNAEEEHAGGAIAFSSYDLGEDFQLSSFVKEVDHTFERMLELCGELMEIQPEGYAIDKQFPDIYFIPENSRITLREQRINWSFNGAVRSIRFSPGITYVLPSGYKLSMVRRFVGGHWRLVGTAAELWEKGNRKEAREFRDLLISDLATWTKDFAAFKPTIKSLATSLAADSIKLESAYIERLRSSVKSSVDLKTLETARLESANLLKKLEIWTKDHPSLSPKQVDAVFELAGNASETHTKAAKALADSALSDTGAYAYSKAERKLEAARFLSNQLVADIELWSADTPKLAESLGSDIKDLATKIVANQKAHANQLFPLLKKLKRSEKFTRVAGLESMQKLINGTISDLTKWSKLFPQVGLVVASESVLDTKWDRGDWGKSKSRPAKTLMDASRALAEEIRKYR